MQLPQRSAIPAGRFNRYIVECKCVFLRQKLRELLRFNRYIVECKFEWHYKDLKPEACFNRYIVECKSKSAGRNCENT